MSNTENAEQIKSEYREKRQELRDKRQDKKKILEVYFRRAKKQN